jgi:hypothetical protein
MYESSEKAFKKFMKSREPASKASIRASKDQNFDIFHPDFIDLNVNEETQDLLN